ncbi:hypothetical protein Pmar_PMAR028813, partial [Perkinsus marinus ATCC 50983]
MLTNTRKKERYNGSPVVIEVGSDGGEAQEVLIEADDAEGRLEQDLAGLGGTLEAVSETDEWLEATVEGGGGHDEFEDAWELADDEATAMDETTGSEESDSEGGSIHKVEEASGALRGVVVGNYRSGVGEDKGDLEANEEMATAGEEVISEDDIDVMMIWEAVETESKRRIEADSTAALEG